MTAIIIYLLIGLGIAIWFWREDDNSAHMVHIKGPRRWAPLMFLGLVVFGPILMGIGYTAWAIDRGLEVFGL